MRPTSYLIALGSNRRHVLHGGPDGVVRAGVEAMAEAGLGVTSVSGIYRTPALGPAGRDFANAVALVTSELDPPALLRELKKIERQFGRRSARRWGARVLDLDIVMWSRGAWPDRLRWSSTPGLVVPHRSMAVRDFVLEPALEIAPEWRHPVLGLTIRQLIARLLHARH